MPEMSLTIRACQYSCNSTAINKNHDSGERKKQKSQKWDAKNVLQNERERTGQILSEGISVILWIVTCHLYVW